MKKRGFLVFLFMAICMIASSMTVMAADERLGTVVGGSLLTDGTEAIVKPPFQTRGTYLAYGTGSLYINGYRRVSITGATNCYRVCDKVKVVLYLERLVGNNWVNVAIVPTKTAYNTNYVSNSNSYSVAGGYYYRMSGGHVAIKGDITESTLSYTDGIWVD